MNGVKFGHCRRCTVLLLARNQITRQKKFPNKVQTVVNEAVPAEKTVKISGLILDEKNRVLARYLNCN